MDGVVRGAEEEFADVCEFHRRVCEFPAAGGGGFYGSAEHAAEDLVAEADAGKAHVRASLPELFQELHEFEDPGVVAVGVVHAAGDDDGADVGGDLFDGGHVAWIIAVFDYEVHVCFDAEGRAVGVAGLLEQVVEDVTEAAAALLGFGVGCVGLEDEHFDGIFGHGGGGVFVG